MILFNRKYYFTGLLVILLYSTLRGQDTESTMPYQMSMRFNPAYTGSRGQGIMQLCYRDYYPGSDLGLASLYLSYDTFIEPLHGGVGVYVHQDKLGSILNSFYPGLTYSYHLRAGKDLYINAGFMASLVYRTYKLDNIVLPDQIDPFMGPVLPSGEHIASDRKLAFDAGVGFLLSYFNYTVGFALNHIAQPGLTEVESAANRLKRRLSLNADAQYDINESSIINPLVFLSVQDNIICGAAGFAASYKSIGLNTLIHADNRKGFYAFQPGIFFKNGVFRLSYNYFLSIQGETLSMPSSLSNMISLTFIINDVDKSAVIKTIKYPYL